MNDLLLYVILALLGVAVTYLIIKIGQPVEISGTRQRREKVDFVDDLGEIGEVLKEIQPEIVKNLKLKTEQAKSLENWINTIDKVTQSKMLKWVIKRFLR